VNASAFAAALAETLYRSGGKNGMDERKDRIARLKAALANPVTDLAKSITGPEGIIAYDLNAPARGLDFSPLLASDDGDPIVELFVRLDELEERVATLVEIFLRDMKKQLAEIDARLTALEEQVARSIHR
jgi:hypothetical protein